MLSANRVDKRTRKDRAWKEPNEWVCSGGCNRVITKTDTFRTTYPVRICKKCHTEQTSKRQRDIVTGQRGVKALVKKRIGNSRCNAKRDNCLACTTPIDEIIEKFTTICMCCSKDVGLLICLDHCHKTGKFRGCLCNRCNSVLRDNTTIDDLYKVIAYLKGHSDEFISGKNAIRE